MENKQCDKCKVDLVGVEYWYGHPERYDGVSEWQCPECKKRIGRWSGKVLKDGESEKRYGENNRNLWKVKKN